NKQSINNKSDNNTKIESDSELIVAKSELKDKKHVSNKIELSNSKNNSDYDNSLLNQNWADNLQSNSEI
ncbi:34200_t:CDS:1, partial [Gigaspora margarita]